MGFRLSFCAQTPWQRVDRGQTGRSNFGPSAAYRFIDWSFDDQNEAAMELLAIWLVTAISLLIISRITLFGIKIESFGTALIVAVVLGLLNAVLRPILSFLSFPLLLLTFGLFSVFINAAVFWLASGLVKGFELRRGCFSALIGPIALAVLNSIILALVR